MAEKWIIEWGSNVYWVCDGSQLNKFQEHPEIGMAHEEKHAQLFAASRLMLEALEEAREYVSNTTTDCRECGEPNSSSSRDKTIRIIDAAISAAKGE